VHRKPGGGGQNVFSGNEAAITGDRYALFTAFFRDFYNTDVLLGKRVSEQTVQASWNVAVGCSAAATLHRLVRSVIARRAAGDVTEM